MADNIDVNSQTWRAVKRFIEKEKSEAVSSLIADQESDKQRGIIEVLERLADTNKKTDVPIPSIKY